MKGGYVYIMSNYTRTTLYIGVTSHLYTRVTQHKNGKGGKFTKNYNCKHLVYFETFERITDAIGREKQLKRWHREWKLNLIKSMNPTLRDLFDEI